jgi:hypothetical protein
MAVHRAVQLLPHQLLPYARIIRLQHQLLNLRFLSQKNNTFARKQLRSFCIEDLGKKQPAPAMKLL